MATTTAAATRPVLIGLLLAALSAGCFIAFSLVAGNTTVLPPAGVQAAGPATSVAPFVLGTRLLNEQNAPQSAPQDTRTDIAEITATPDVETEVLGKRVRNRARNHNSGDAGGSIAMTPTQTDGSSSSTFARTKASSSNGNAYGHYKDKAQGNAYGHTGSPGNSGNSHGKGPKKKN